MLLLNIKYDWFNSLTTLYIITYMVIDKGHTFYSYRVSWLLKYILFIYHI